MQKIYRKCDIMYKESVIEMIDNISESIMDSEISVCESMIESYSKAIDILENCDYDNTDVSSFEIFSESYIMESAGKKNKNENKKENIIIRAYRKMKEIILKIIDKILSLFGSSRNKNKEEEELKKPKSEKRKNILKDIGESIGKDIVSFIKYNPIKCLTFCGTAGIVSVKIIKKYKEVKNTSRAVIEIYNECLKEFSKEEQEFIKFSRRIINNDVNLASYMMFNPERVYLDLDSIKTECHDIFLVFDKLAVDSKDNTTFMSDINTNKLPRLYNKLKQDIQTEYELPTKDEDARTAQHYFHNIEPFLVGVCKEIKDTINKIDDHLEDENLQQHLSQIKTISNTLCSISSEILHFSDKYKNMNKNLEILIEFDTIFLEKINDEMKKSHKTE